MTRLYTELAEFVSALKEGPMSAPAEDEWVLERTLTPGLVHEISEEEFYFWRDFFASKWMRWWVVSHFCIQERDEPFRLFWRKVTGDTFRYFTRQLTWDETEKFCRFAYLPTPY